MNVVNLILLINDLSILQALIGSLLSGRIMLTILHYYFLYFCALFSETFPYDKKDTDCQQGRNCN